MAVGATDHDHRGDNSGSTFLYRIREDGWQLMQTISGEGAGDYSGWSVALSGNGERVAIGAIYNDGGGEFSGHIRMFESDY